MDGATRHFRRFGLAPGLSTGDGLQAMLDAALAGLYGEKPPTSAPSAEAVHHFRVSLRRLRSVLSAFRAALPAGERQALSRHLRAAAQGYGCVRDWDVFLVRIVLALRQEIADEPVLEALREAAEAARHAALPEGETLDNARAAIIGRVEDAVWLRHPAPGLARSWDRPLAEHTAALLAEEHRRLERGVNTVDLAEQAVFHKLRIHVKKIRYPMELLRTFYDHHRATAYLDRLIDLQEVLGGLNDALTGRLLAARLALPPEANGLVLGWIAHEMKTLVGRFPEVAGAFRRAEPFWES